jgi:hypothetical protein
MPALPGRFCRAAGWQNDNIASLNETVDSQPQKDYLERRTEDVNHPGAECSHPIRPFTFSPPLEITQLAPGAIRVFSSFDPARCKRLRRALGAAIVKPAF